MRYRSPADVHTVPGQQRIRLDGNHPGRVTTARDDPNRIRKRSRIGPELVDDASRVVAIGQG
jgi:hypothetical protein